jgi:hypothetical protein
MSVKAITPSGLATRTNSATRHGLSGTWEGLLADHHIESAIGERHRERVAEAKVDQVAEPDHLRQADRAFVPARGDVDPGDPAAMMTGQIARGPAQAAADVEDAAPGADARLPCEHVDRRKPAEVVLIVVLQDGFGQPVERNAVPRQMVQDLPLVDRMGIVETDDRTNALGPGHTSHSGGGTTPVWAVISP